MLLSRWSRSYAHACRRCLATLATLGEIAPVVSLRLAIPARLDLGRVPAAFGRPDADWLGQRVPDEASEMRHFSCDLELSVGPDRRAMFRKSAIVGVGAPARHGMPGSFPSSGARRPSRCCFQSSPDTSASVRIESNSTGTMRHPAEPLGICSTGRCSVSPRVGPGAGSCGRSSRCLRSTLVGAREGAAPAFEAHCPAASGRPHLVVEADLSIDARLDRAQHHTHAVAG